MECPDYASTGKCRRKNCHLPHVDRAGQIRHYMTNNATHSSNHALQQSAEEGQSDVSSEEEDVDEIDSDDVDSEGLDEDMTLGPDDQSSVSLSQQHDFVGF